MSDTGTTTLVFRRQEGGELSAITSDLEIGPMSVLQFDVSTPVKVGKVKQNAVRF